MAIFNPNRTEGGTIKLVKDANGNYTTQEVGFNTLASLSIPDFKTTATTTTTTDTKTATDNTGDTITSQTQMAFQMPGSDDNRIDTTGEMLQESAKKLSDSLQTVDTRAAKEADFASGVYNNRLSADEAAPQENILDVPEVKDPTSKVFRSETDRFKQEFDPTKVDATLTVDKDLKGSAAVQRGLIEPPGFNFDFLKGDRFRGSDGSTTRAAKEADFASGTIGSDTSATRAAKEADFASGKLGVSEPSATRAAKEADFASGTFTGQSATRAAKEADFASGTFAPKRSALETVSTSLRTTKDSILSKIKTPMMMVLEAVATPRNETEAAVNFNKSYFTDRGDGRIGGNPATDLFAGMNRVSAFGNLNQAGARRIARREKTIATKNVSDKFKRDTEKMKEQLNDYRENKAKDRDERMGNTKTNVTGFGKSGFGRDPDDVTGGSDGSSSGGKIVCTMMNESYGFGSFRNKIWLRHSKNLAPEYQIGYHRIFLPLVKKAKTNKVLKKILEHIAIHRTIDIRQEERNKTHLLGRVYRTILEPICYWVGKI
jgi:hypothetical protein